MSKKKARIEIAKDVLAELDAQDSLFDVKRASAYYVREAAGYLKLPAKFRLDVVGRNTSLKKFLQKERPKCTVSASGALFVAHVLRHNKFNLCGMNSGYRTALYLPENTATDRLSSIFSMDSLILIENAFEGPDFWAVMPWCSAASIRAKKMYPKSWSAKKILRAICENIIKNGDFVVE